MSHDLIFNKIEQPLSCTNATYPCQNGGQCSNINGVSANALVGFTCNCPVGYSGNLCQKGKFYLNYKNLNSKIKWIVF